MAVRHDMQCEVCGKTDYDVLCEGKYNKNCLCGGKMDIIWQHQATSHTGIHPRDRAVVWYNPETGKHATPGRNDIPMPDRYRKAGYERREFETLRSLDNYCKSNNLVNEKAHYNSSGRGYDDED